MNSSVNFTPISLPFPPSLSLPLSFSGGKRRDHQGDVWRTEASSGAVCRCYEEDGRADRRQGRRWVSRAFSSGSGVSGDMTATEGRTVWRRDVGVEGAHLFSLWLTSAGLCFGVSRESRDIFNVSVLSTGSEDCSSGQRKGSSFSTQTDSSESVWNSKEKLSETLWYNILIITAYISLLNQTALSQSGTVKRNCLKHFDIIYWS